MIGAMQTAGLWNAHRTKKSDRVWKWTDFHPDHVTEQEARPMSGREVVHSIRASCENWEWLPGYGPSDL